MPRIEYSLRLQINSDSIFHVFDRDPAIDECCLLCKCQFVFGSTSLQFLALLCWRSDSFLSTMNIMFPHTVSCRWGQTLFQELPPNALSRLHQSHECSARSTNKQLLNDSHMLQSAAPRLDRDLSLRALACAFEVAHP